MSTVTTPLDLDAIKAREAAATPGPWGWRGNTDYPDSIRLACLHSGLLDVLGLVRHEVTREEARRGGVGDPDFLEVTVAAEPAETYDKRCDAAIEAAREEAITEYLDDGYGGRRTELRLAFVDDGFYREAERFAVYEVCREATDRNDKRLYRHDIVDLRAANAQFIAHARSDVAALIAEVEQLRTALTETTGTPA